MNQVPIIVINSSDEEQQQPEKIKAEIETKPKIMHQSDKDKRTNEVFQEFSSLCNTLIKQSGDKEGEGAKILDHLEKQHVAHAAKFSREYRKSLQKCVKKMKNGNNKVYVHVLDILSVLDGNTPQSTDNSLKSSKLEAKPHSSSKFQEKEFDEDCKPSSSGQCIPDASKSKRPKLDSSVKGEKSSPSPDGYPVLSSVVASRIEKLEKHLVTLSKEIVKLQTTELTLDDLESGESPYIQEAKLKERFVKVYAKVSRSKSCDPDLRGEVMKSRIKVTSSSYSVINKKIERFVNNPKNDQDLPDFADICDLVKKASTKNDLGLSPSDINAISKSIFEEVGRNMQNLRKQDYWYHLGCQETDDNLKDDPAKSDSALHETLKKNHEIAVRNLESVINKYASMTPDTREGDAELTGSSPDAKQSGDDD